jgi:hypothetical protein
VASSHEDIWEQRVFPSHRNRGVVAVSASSNALSREPLIHNPLWDTSQPTITKTVITGAAQNGSPSLRPRLSVFDPDAARGPADIGALLEMNATFAARCRPRPSATTS